ncbi:hypothetical protein [Actibacterium ureilyticum]|nr:hypothetical protein [Actibacterium ureilyticum]
MRSLPVAVCVMQMVNHQTLRRGPIRAMPMAAGPPGRITDRRCLPDDI